MQRIIFVPQYPTPLRYQEWWIYKIPQKLREAGFEVVTLGEKWLRLFGNTPSDESMFSPINMAITFEAEQIQEYMEMKLYTDDILFLADLSFPGFFGNVLYHKKPSQAYAFCHATSINTYDYFQDVSYSKFLVERAYAKVFDKIFVGSYYHRDKLQWDNIEIVYLPYPPFKGKSVKWEDKYYDIMSASRPTKQKVDLELEKEVGKKFSQVNRPISKSWGEYFNHLAYSKVLLITSHEDTFGYQIIDAILNGCIPIARNSLAYPEILPSTYLYSDKKELFRRLEDALSGKLVVPQAMCHDEMEEFYKNIIETFREGG